MQAFSILFGLVALLFMGVGLIPFLGLLNWFVMPFGVIGVVLGVFGKGRRPGLTINIVVLAVAALRLILGGGVF